MKNIFTELTSLRNEKSVEKNFIYPLIRWLNYKDSLVRVDESIESIEIPKGNTKELFRPDAVLFVNDKPRIVIEVKAPNANLIKATYQVASYALMINRRYSSINPIRYCIISDGLVTHIMNWDSIQPFMTIKFSKWKAKNKKVAWVKNNLSFDRFQREMWFKVGRIGDQPVEQEASMLIHNEAISWATMTRFLHVARHDGNGYGAALENPWHRTSYFQLVQLNWIEPEDIDKAHFENLRNMKSFSKSYFSRLVGFNLTNKGRKVLKLLKTDPEFKSRFNIKSFFNGY